MKGQVKTPESGGAQGLLLDGSVITLTGTSTIYNHPHLGWKEKENI